MQLAQFVAVDKTVISLENVALLMVVHDSLHTMI